MKKINKKGFTLAELLIVVAIIAVLVAIAIPVFNAQLEKSREATDLANLRSAYAEAVATYLTTGTAATSSTPYKVQQKTAGWSVDATALESALQTASSALANATSGTFTVTYDVDTDGTTPKVTVNVTSATTAGG